LKLRAVTSASEGLRRVPFQKVSAGSASRPIFPAKDLTDSGNLWIAAASQGIRFGATGRIAALGCAVIDDESKIVAVGITCRGAANALNLRPLSAGLPAYSRPGGGRRCPHAARLSGHGRRAAKTT